MKPMIELTEISKQAIRNRKDREIKARLAAQRRFDAEQYQIKNKKRSMHQNLIASLLFLIAVFSGMKVYAGDVDCLAAIMYGEARGQNFEGVIGLGQSAITRADNQGKTLCKETGVVKVNPPKPMDEYFKALAKHLIKHPSVSVSRGANAWNTGDKPRQPGQITRKIDDHTLYILSSNGEKP